MVEACFVILHYNAIDETQKCVDSIQKMEKQSEIAIVIVDNASPNGSGEKLFNKYSNNENIKVILKENNDGFSKGNNEGCIFAMNEWNPRFLIVTNNDIEFPQRDFVEQIQKEYQKSKFDILGPDILNPNTHLHQSPMASDPPELRSVNKTIFLNRFMLLLYPLVYPIMKKYFLVLDNIETAVTPCLYQENVCLMGACLIYSHKYIVEREKVFDPETKFYYEENIQTVWCRKNGKKIVYQPELKVWHWERRATETINIALRKTIKFRMKNILDSAKIYRNFLCHLNK